MVSISRHRYNVHQIFQILLKIYLISYNHIVLCDYPYMHSIPPHYIATKTINNSHISNAQVYIVYLCSYVSFLLNIYLISLLLQCIFGYSLRYFILQKTKLNRDFLFKIKYVHFYLGYFI